VGEGETEEFAKTIANEGGVRLPYIPGPRTNTSSWNRWCNGDRIFVCTETLCVTNRDLTSSVP
jgi:hypothetical protein